MGCFRYIVSEPRVSAVGEARSVPFPPCSVVDNLGRREGSTKGQLHFDTGA